jgi:hypothetical protein
MKTKTLSVYSALWLLTTSVASFAADMPFKSPEPPPPRAMTGFFIGLGGGYNSAKVEQEMFGLGLTNVFNGAAVLVGTGYALGPSFPFSEVKNTFAPEAQLGFIGNIGASNWLWGAKFQYKYLNATTIQSPVVIPQVGQQFPVGGGAPTTLTGNVLIQSSQNTVNHELKLLALVGQSFGNINVYLGGGPALLETKTAVYRAVGFGDVNGQPTDITGAPVNFVGTQWVWGGAGQIGMTYAFASTWFLDFNYTFAMTDKYKNKFEAPFTSTSNGLTYNGIATLTTTQRVTTQAFGVTINKAF